MTELEKTKHQAINSLRRLCVNCDQKERHDCPVSKLILQIENLNGIPVIVNEQLKHLVFN